MIQDRDQVGSCFARTYLKYQYIVAALMARGNNSVSLTSLGDRQQIESYFDGWDAVLLDRSWSLVAAQLDISKHDRVQSSILKRTNRLDALKALLVHVDLLNPV